MLNQVTVKNKYPLPRIDDLIVLKSMKAARNRRRWIGEINWKEGRYKNTPKQYFISIKPNFTKEYIKYIKTEQNNKNATT